MEHYDVEIFQEHQSNFEYYFITQHKIKYFLKFSSAAYLFSSQCLSCSNIFDFSFYPERKSIPDPKVFTTIIKLILEFIEKHQCPIIFVCDDTDQKGPARLRLFKQKATNFEDKFLFQDLIISGDYSLYIGIFSHISDANFFNYLAELDLEDII